MRGIVVVAIAVLAGFTASISRAEELSGRRAEEYIGVFAEKFSGQKYAVLVLERRNRSFETGGMIDALVFIPAREGADNKYRFIRRLDEDYVLRMYIREGLAPVFVAPGDISRYQRLIKDNGLSPVVVRDKDGAEVLIAYCGLRPCSISWRKEANGGIFLQLYKTFRNEEYRGPEFSPGLFK